MTISWQRRVVPQWTKSTDPGIRFLKNDSDSLLKRENSLSDADLDQLKKVASEFEAEPSIGLAADALRFGLSQPDNEKLRIVAGYVLNSQSIVPIGLRRLAEAIHTGDITKASLHGPLDLNKPVHAAIHDTRRWLSRFPRDSLSWLDLGRLHAAAGNTLSAKQAVQTAHALSPQNRTILRGTSRFFLHAREPDIALSVLDQTARTEKDPWLMAGHLAISSILGKTSRFVKKAKKIVASDAYAPHEITELAGSLATLELEAGYNKEARRLFNISLVEPNENVLAQVQWASKQLNLEPDLPEEWLQNPISSEAGYYHSLLNDQFEGALANALNWHIDEPFASRPMIGASFIAGISGNFTDASNYARQGLISEPENAMLLNNLAFSTGAQGDLENAERIIRKIAALERKALSPHTLANLGMLAYLRNEHVLGAQLYETATQLYRKQRRIEEAASAACFHAYFARLTNAASADALHARAKQEVEESRSRIAQSIFLRLTRTEAKDTAPAVRQAAPRKWHYDQQKNLLIFEKHFPLGKV